MNYPNPFINETTISADHNRPDNDLEIIIRIFSLNGGLIKTLRSSANSGGYAIPPIEWDGLNDGGERVSGGIYPYTLSLTTETGESAIASGRMIIL
jgi:flagellar hook assembly protein FlgD